MITVLLKQIIQLLKGWIESFNNHAEAVEESLTDLNNTASDIELNTDPIPEIRDNTGAIITPITQIKTNTDSIKNDVSNIAVDTIIIKNNANSISTSAGAAAAFAEDCATNTLDIKDKITTIASDTTQLRADSANIAADVSSINQAIGYYVANTLVTEDSEGDICNFDTDMEDYLQKAICTIPADGSGFSSITITKNGKNICPVLTGVNTNGLITTVNADGSIHVSGTATGIGGYITVSVNFPFTVKSGTQITASVTTTLNASLRMIFNNGVIDISPNTTNRTITLSNDISSGRLYLFTTANQAYDLTFKFQIELGSAATEYEAYKIMTYPVSFGSTITDGAEVDLLSGIVKINTSPVTYSSITPIAIRTYKGVNNIYSDVGSMSLTYRETLKHYLDRQQ